jgi:hypothetical protein
MIARTNRRLLTPGVSRRPLSPRPRVVVIEYQGKLAPGLRVRSPLTTAGCGAALYNGGSASNNRDLASLLGRPVTFPRLQPLQLPASTSSEVFRPA